MEAMMKRRYFHVVVAVAAMILLGAMAWGIGRGARSLLERQAAPLPTQKASPTSPPKAKATPTHPPASRVPTAFLSTPPTSTLRPTSTPAPTVTPTATPAWETVQAGEGLYQVCRRHCPGRWPGHSVPPDLEEYAHYVAHTNGLRWGTRGPTLRGGERLRMPTCPR